MSQASSPGRCCCPLSLIRCGGPSAVRTRTAAKRALSFPFVPVRQLTVRHLALASMSSAAFDRISGTCRCRGGPRYRLTPPASNVQPSYNVCPTDTVNVVTSFQDTRILQPMRWGLIPRWWSKPLKDLMRLSTFNARVETVTTKPFFRAAFKRTRCIIPASGYYEWQDTPDGKQPHYFTRTDGQVISFAGLWDEWKDRATGEMLKSCTMIITEPNAMVAQVHDRMPVLLAPDQFTPWLENEAGLGILPPAGAGGAWGWARDNR